MYSTPDYVNHQSDDDLTKLISENYLKALATKNNQKIAGKKAQIRGEKTKNMLATNLTFQPGEQINDCSLVLAHYLDIDPTQIQVINSKTHEDKGIYRAIKKDLSSTIEYYDNGCFHKITKRISLKSVFQLTQVAKHSVSKFIHHLEVRGIEVPENVKEFLYLFCYPDHEYMQGKSLPLNPSKTSIRRRRFNWEEIAYFKFDLFLATQQFFKEHARAILRLILMEGDTYGKKELYADTIAFFHPEKRKLSFLDLEEIIDKIIHLCEQRDDWCFPQAFPRVKGNTTTLSLFCDTVKLQMYGSGDKRLATAHDIQFRISGNILLNL